jgi:hypothetical protein
MAEALLRALALHATLLYVVGGLLEMGFGGGVSEVATRLFDSLSVGWCRSSLVPSTFDERH